jgi:uncharacterized protein YndB with AHSA1/START domain
MASTPIHANDEITIPAPLSDVWPVLADVAGYPRWWPRSLGVRVLSTGGELLGTEVEMRPSGGRPFLCRVEAVEAPTRIRMRYGGGFIEGFGEWRLEPLGAQTRVSYQLEVQARGWLVFCLGKVMNLASVHSRSMQEVLKNLKHVLDQNPHRTNVGQ